MRLYDYSSRHLSFTSGGLFVAQYSDDWQLKSEILVSIHGDGHKYSLFTFP